MRNGVAAVVLGAWIAGSAGAQQSEPKVVPSPNEQFTDWGRVTHTVPVASSEGVWDGTWIYVNRDRQIALWFKTEGGAPKVKLRYLDLSSGEGFETDWEGKSEYEVRQSKGRFSLGPTRRDAARIEGHWDWVLEAGKGARIEVGDYHMYRTGDGRYLAMNFEELERTVHGSNDRVYTGSVSLTFIKVSKRLVLWDELPF